MIPEVPGAVPEIPVSVVVEATWCRPPDGRWLVARDAHTLTSVEE